MKKLLPATNSISGSGANISGSHNSVGAINGNNITLKLPGKGYEKIISSDGSEMTIEAHSFDMEYVSQIEAENKKLRAENDKLKKQIMKLQSRLIMLLTPISEN